MANYYGCGGLEDYFCDVASRAGSADHASMVWHKFNVPRTSLLDPSAKLDLYNLGLRASRELWQYHSMSLLHRKASPSCANSRRYRLGILL